MTPVLVSGVFRSGTTLVGKMLSAHPHALVISDPCIYFFKAYRDHLFQCAGITDIVPSAPTSDWFDPPQHDALRRILDADFSEVMPTALKDRVRADIRNWKGDQHPNLIQQIEQVNGTTFADFFRALLRLMAQTYGMGHETVVGTKVSWCEEFLPAMSRAFPDMSFVLVQRDLRAVIASQNQREGPGKGKRPLLFYIRHWRKAYAFHHRFASMHPNRVMSLRYEDLVQQPASHADHLCTHLSLSPHPSMTEAKAFHDEGRNQQWQANSSFESAQASGFFTDSIDRWKTVLHPNEIQAVEALAGPELLASGYDLSGRYPPEVYLNDHTEPAFEDLASWLQEHAEAQYLRYPAGKKMEFAREALRLRMLNAIDSVDPAVIDRFFMDGAVHAHLHQLWTQNSSD